ncbi:MAG: ABC transporter permease [Gammaproteobacteria bacterium]|nr:ABC transporter permease [Gammaproteobacteria bacterium]
MSKSSLNSSSGWLRSYTVIYLVFIYLPILFLPLFSFNDGIYVAFPMSGFTLNWWAEMVNQPGMHKALWNSFSVAVPVCLISTTLGMMGAKALTTYKLYGARALTGLFTLPLVTPFLILGIALLISFDNYGIDLSLFTVGVGHVLICVPFSLFVLLSRMESFDRSLEEVALDLGETPWMMFWRVTFPIAMPGIVASLLLTFTISFDEFLLAFFLTGDASTLPIFIWSQLRFPGKLPAVLALGSAILIVTVFIVIVAELMRRKGSANSTENVI